MDFFHFLPLSSGIKLEKHTAGREMMGFFPEEKEPYYLAKFRKWSWAFYNCCKNGGQNGLGLIQESKIIEIFMKMPYVGLDTTASGLLGWHTKQ